MHYLIYRTTNLVNGKYYVGKHRTKDFDDNYLGSGKLLKRAIEKYGRENFAREIILECSSEEEMNLAEKILVVPDQEVNYNLCPGGKGGWGYINTVTTLEQRSFRGRIGGPIMQRNLDFEERSRRSKLAYQKCKRNNNGITNKITFLGKFHTEETKKKMSHSQRGKQEGSLNSQFGTCWMTDGARNIKVKRDEVDRWIEMGYKRGRIN